MEKLRAEIREVKYREFKTKMYNIYCGEKYLYSLPEYDIKFKDGCESIEVIEDELYLNVEDSFSLLMGRRCSKSDYRCAYSKHLVTPYRVTPL